MRRTKKKWHCIPIAGETDDTEAAVQLTSGMAAKTSNPWSIRLRCRLTSGETSNPWSLLPTLMRGANSFAAFHATYLMFSLVSDIEQPSSMFFMWEEYSGKLKLLAGESPLKNKTAASNAMAAISAVGNVPRWTRYFVPSGFLPLVTLESHRAVGRVLLS